MASNVQVMGGLTHPLAREMLRISNQNTKIVKGGPISPNILVEWRKPGQVITPLSMRLDANIPLGIHLGLHVLHQLDWNQSLEPQFWPIKSKQWNVLKIAWKTSSIRIKHAISSHVQFVFRPLNDAIAEENPTVPPSLGGSGSGTSPRDQRSFPSWFDEQDQAVPRPGPNADAQRSMGNWDFSDELGWQFQTFGNKKEVETFATSWANTDSEQWRDSMKVHKFGFWQIPPMRSLTSETSELKNPAPNPSMTARYSLGFSTAKFSEFSSWTLLFLFFSYRIGPSSQGHGGHGMARAWHAISLRDPRGFLHALRGSWLCSFSWISMKIREDWLPGSAILTDSFGSEIPAGLTCWKDWPVQHFGEGPVFRTLGSKVCIFANDHHHAPDRTEVWTTKNERKMNQIEPSCTWRFSSVHIITCISIHVDTYRININKINIDKLPNLNSWTDTAALPIFLFQFPPFSTCSPTSPRLPRHHRVPRSAAWPAPDPPSPRRQRRWAMQRRQQRLGPLGSRRWDDRPWAWTWPQKSDLGKWLDSENKELQVMSIHGLWNTPMILQPCILQYIYVYVHWYHHLYITILQP